MIAAAPPALLRAHQWLARHLLVTLAGTAALVAACTWASFTARVDSDMSELLPGGPGSPREAAKLLSDFGTLDTLLLDLELPGATVDQLLEAGATFEQRARESGRFASVNSGPSEQDLFTLGRVLAPRRLLLLDDPRAQVERRLAAPDLPERLARVKARLLGPEGFALKQLLLGDPLELNEAMLARSGVGGGGVQYRHGHLMTPDERHLLYVATPKASALSIDDSLATLAALGALERQLPKGPGGPAKLIVAGGPRFAAESATAIRGEVTFNFLSTALALVIIFLVRFRSLRLLLLASVPVGIGVVGGIATVALARGHIHGLSLGFGAALIGIAMDYPLYLINRWSEEEGTSLERFAASVRACWSSLLFGYATTAVAFAVLAASSMPGLREMAFFSGAGITVAYLATLVLLPPLVVRLGGSSRRRVTWAPSLSKAALRHSLAVPVFALLLAVAAFAARRLQFDGDFAHLDSQRPQTVADYELVMSRLGQGAGSSLVAVEGSDAEQALGRAEAVVGRLNGTGHVRAVHSASELVPSQALQRQRAAALQGLDLAAARERLAAAAAPAGFSPKAFDAFFTELEEAAAGRISPLLPDQLAGTALEPLVTHLLRCEAARCRAIVTFERQGISAADLATALPAGARLVDREALAQDAAAEIPRQLLLLCGLGLVSNVLLLWLVYRSLRSAVVVCLPSLLGLVGTLGVMAALGLPLDLVSAGGLVLVLGAGVDYGIFVFDGLRAGGTSGVQAMGVVLASSSTLASFGTLAYGTHRALTSLGISVGLGIGFSALISLLLLPGLAWLSGVRRAPAPPAPAPEVT